MIGRELVRLLELDFRLLEHWEAFCGRPTASIVTEARKYARDPKFRPEVRFFRRLLRLRLKHRLTFPRFLAEWDYYIDEAKQLRASR